MKYVYTVCFLVAVALVLGSLWVGWRLDSPLFGIKREADLQASAREVEALCSQAQMKVKNVKAGERCEDIGEKLIKDYGEAMAATLRTACSSGRIIVEKNLLFFPTKSLCQREDLPSTCGILCNRWRSKNEKQ